MFFFGNQFQTVTRMFTVYDSRVVIPINKSIPIMSFIIAMNGPVAIAGSILNFSNVIGTSVPNIDANITTAKRLIDTEQVTVAVGPNLIKL